MRTELSAPARETLGAAFSGGILAPIAAVIATGQRAGALRDPLRGGLSPVSGAGLFMAFVAHFLDRPLVGERLVQPGGPETTATLLVDVFLGGLGA
jgi:hypothetical protein